MAKLRYWQLIAVDSEGLLTKKASSEENLRHHVPHHEILMLSGR